MCGATMRNGIGFVVGRALRGDLERERRSSDGVEDRGADTREHPRPAHQVEQAALPADQWHIDRSEPPATAHPPHDGEQGDRRARRECEERQIGQPHPWRAGDQRKDRRKHRYRPHQGPERVPELAEHELDLHSPREALEHPRGDREQQVREAARPLELLHHQIRERLGPIAMSDRVDCVRSAPTCGLQQQRGRVILCQFGAQAADGAQCACAHRVVRPDAERGEAAGLYCAVHRGLGMRPRAHCPGGVRVGVADAGCGHISDGRITERPQHRVQVAGLGHMIGVELHHEVVVVESDRIVEVRQVALFALRAARPLRCGDTPRGHCGCRPRRCWRCTTRSLRRRGPRRPARCRAGVAARAFPPAFGGPSATVRMVPWSRPWRPDPLAAACRVRRAPGVR